MVKTRYPYLATARAGYYYLRKRDPATGKLRTLGRIKGEPGTTVGVGKSKEV